MILYFKINKRQKKRKDYKRMKWSENTINIKNTSTRVGFMPLIHFKGTLTELCLISGEARLFIQRNFVFQESDKEVFQQDL